MGMGTRKDITMEEVEHVQEEMRRYIASAHYQYHIQE
jgi:hypothetical protein